MSLPWRTVSLFVSSTFRDTQLERDILVRRVFPRLRQSLSKHRINLAEIDLRWGVTSEQDSVQVCAEVLKESLPRFLGIIGARYGWIPDNDNPEGISITEREMRMALEHPSARPVFLLRNPAVPDRLSDPDLLTDADDVANLASKQAKLSALLEFVRSSKSDIYTYQPTANNGRLSLGTTFEDTAYAAILSSLENDPELAPWFELSAGDTDVSFAEAAQAFAHERTRGFNASLRSREIADLDVASKTDGYILVTGGGGLGKSSLVAQAYLSALAGGDRKVVGAFVGGMRGTGSSHELLTNLVRSLTDDPLETEMTKLAEQFLSALHTEKPLLFLDGLDRLTDAGRLSWLPYGLPSGTTVVISTMDDTLAQPFRDRGAVEVRVDALSLADARTVLLGHLHRYRKVLEPRQVDALLAKTDATSPLYLACVAEELRTLGVREELDRHIAAMPPDVGGLFLWVLRRLESDRQFRWEDGATKVRRLLSCIGVSRDGLSESELCGLVNDASGDVAVLLRLLQPYLSRRGDLLSLHHRAHGEALRGIGIGEESRRLLDDEHPGYLDEDSEIDAAREVLANFFDGSGSTVVSERQAYEWPHQLFHLKAWDRLERCLLTGEIFEHLSDDERKWELTGYWHPLRAEPLSLDMGALYLEAFEQWKTGDDKLDACIASRLGSFHYANGLYDLAEPLHRRALETRERILGPEHPDTLSSLGNLAILMYAKGDLAAAEPLYRRALETQERILGPEHPHTLISVNNYAYLLDDKGDLAAAEILHRRALETRERILGPEHPDTLKSLNNLANVLSAKGDLAVAEPLYFRALEALERILGPEHPDTLTSVNNMALFLKGKGDLSAAEPLYRRALETGERILGPEHPKRLDAIFSLATLREKQGDLYEAEILFRRELQECERILGLEDRHTLGSLINLANLLRGKGDLAAAEPLYRRALETQERILGPEHPHTLISLNNYAYLLDDKGDLAGAEILHRRALETRERILGPEHSDTLKSLNNLANLLRGKGDLAVAEPLYRRALETQERILGPEHPHTLISVNNLASLLEGKGDLAAAEPLYRRELEVRERILGPEHPATLKSVGNLASLLYAKGDFVGAEPLYRRALESFERILGPEHPDTLLTVNNLAILLNHKGDFARADLLFHRALEAFERLLGPDHPVTLSCVNNLANLLSDKGDLANAEPLYRRTLEARERILGPEHPDTLGSLSNLANLLKREGYLAEAESLYRRTHETFERVLGPEHPHTLRSLSNLATLLHYKGDLAAAEPLYRRALETGERILGPDHPHTLISVNNLAILSSDKGELTGAEQLLRRALEVRYSILGPEHPDTKKSAYALNRLLETRRIVELIKGRMDCERCLGTGFVAHSDIVRLGMQSEWTPGPCQLCREAAAIDDKT